MIQSTVTYSQIEDRLDAEYYKPDYLAVAEAVKQAPTKKLSVFLEKYHTGYPFDSSVYRADGVPLIRISNLNSWFFDCSYDVTLPDLSEWQRFKTKSGDILISMSGTIGLASIVFDCPGYFVNQRIAALKLKDIDHFFLIAFLNCKYGRLPLERIGTGGVQTNIRIEDIKNLQIPVLNAEQEKHIAGLVRQAHQKRQLAKQKYEEARRLVNEFLGIRESDFSFEQSFSMPFSKIEDRLDCGYYQPLELLELPMFKKGAIPLGGLATISAGKTPAKHAYTKQGVRILKVRDLTNQGIDWDEGDRAYAKEEVWEKTERARVKENDLLLISAAHQAYYIGQEIDIVFDIPEEHNSKLLAVAELLVVRPRKINPYLLLWYLRTQVAYRLIQRLITGETSHLYAKDLVNLPIPKKLLNFQDAKKVEGLTKESLLLKKESKKLLEQAKQEVEKIITQSS
jgi:hypothetical protein